MAAPDCSSTPAAGYAAHARKRRHQPSVSCYVVCRVPAGRWPLRSTPLLRSADTDNPMLPRSRDGTAIDAAGDVPTPVSALIAALSQGGEMLTTPLRVAQLQRSVEVRTQSRPREYRLLSQQACLSATSWCARCLVHPHDVVCGALLDSCAAVAIRSVLIGVMAARPSEAEGTPGSARLRRG